MQQVYRDSVDSYIYILIKTGLNVKEKIKTTKKKHAVADSNNRQPLRRGQLVEARKRVRVYFFKDDSLLCRLDISEVSRLTMNGSAQHIVGLKLHNIIVNIYRQVGYYPRDAGHE
jgi:uncharacterized protein YqfB (UPF0267 family)